MKTRAQQGSTLSLVIACTIVIALLGIGFIFMTFLFGGHREAQGAVDSGSLNVSKRAILSPAVPTSALASDIGRAMAANLTAPQGSNVNMGTGVNLLSFNRMVAQAMLVSLNAEAEGQGDVNAKSTFDFVEGSAGSIGAQLKTLLSDDASGNWAQTDYNEVSGNVLKMLGGQGAPTYKASDFAVGYMNQKAGDFVATNVDMSAYDPSNTGSYNSAILPIKDYSNPGQRNQFNSKCFVKGTGAAANISYMAGYTAMTTGGSNFMGVPTNPGMQPHLESNTMFAQQTAQPGAGSVYLPPNAFKVGGESAATPMGQDAKAGMAHVVSVSMIGTPQTPFRLQIPGGYIVVDNSASQSFSGKTPNTDNVAADELGTGITVDSKTGYFSYGTGSNGKGNLIDQWQDYDHDPKNFQASANDPPYQGIYDRSGKELQNADQAAQIPYCPNPQASDSVLCTDNNSSAPGGKPICIEEATAPPGGLCPFDKAYHPNSLSSNGGQMSTSDATASELAQCQVIDLYGPTPHGGGPAEDYNFSFGPTGIRKYPNNLPSPTNQYAWLGPNGNGFGMAPDNVGVAVHTSTSSTCKVTEEGTIEDYFKQVAQGNNVNVQHGASASSVQAFLQQRMLEIFPGATAAQMKAILDTKIGLGKNYFIYLKNGALTIDETGPAYVAGQSNGARQADGKVHQMQSTYEILEGVANPYYSYGIHDRLFTTWGQNGNKDDRQGSINVTQTASFQPASGAFGLLGIVQFRETSSASGGLGFNNRD